MDVVRHEAIAEEIKGTPSLEIAQGFEERRVIVIVMKDDSAVVASVDRVINELVIDGSEGSGHRERIHNDLRQVKNPF
jgi:hypothetical protein